MRTDLWVGSFFMLMLKKTGILRGQTYYIAVEGSASNTGGSYHFSVSTSDEHYEIEPNNDFGYANTVQSNTFYMGESKYYSDGDFYKFLAGGNNVMLQFEHGQQYFSNSDFQIKLYNASKELMAEYFSLSGLNAEYQTGVMVGQPYYLMIIGEQNNIEGKYRFKISFSNENFEVEPNNDFGFANLIKENLNYQGESLNRYDEDYYRFIPTKNETTLSFEHLSAYCSTSDFRVIVYDNNLDLVRSFDSMEGLNSEIKMNLVIGKMYFLLIRGYSDNTGGKYKFKIF